MTATKATPELAAILESGPIFGGSTPVPQGINSIGDALATYALDNVDLNLIWDHVVVAMEEWNTRRSQISSLLAFSTTLPGEAVPHGISTPSFEKLTEHGLPMSANVPASGLILGYDFAETEFGAPDARKRRTGFGDRPNPRRFACDRISGTCRNSGGARRMRLGERERVHGDLADRIRTCTLCDGLNIKGKTQSAPGFGSLRSPVVIVGQSLCGPCMAKQEPFYGGVGGLLNRAFADALKRKADLYITNVVHCHPPGNRESLPSEIENCTPYLVEELAIVRPRLIIGLGENARDVVGAIYPKSRRLEWPLESVLGMTPPTANSPDILFPTHPGAFRWKPKVERAELTEQFVDCLARAVRWGFGVVELPPTCEGMADIPQPLPEPKGRR